MNRMTSVIVLTDSELQPTPIVIIRKQCMMISVFNDHHHFLVISTELLSYRISLDYWIYTELDFYPAPFSYRTITQKTTVAKKLPL